MKLPLYHHVLLLLTIIFLVSCEYSPDGIFEQDVKTPDLSYETEDGFSFFNTVVNDTVFVHFDDLRISYASPDSKREIKGARYSLNGGSTIKVEHVYNPQFEVELEQLKVGVNKLRVELDFNSGTNSLADKVGLEFVTATKEVIVYRIPWYSTAAHSLKATPVDGALKVEWSPYPYHDFTKYELYNIKRIFDANETYYIDNNFFESYGKQYELNVYAGVRSVSSKTINVSYPLPKLNYEEKDNGFLFSWAKTKFYKADFKYVVGGYYDDIVWFQSFNKNDTSFFIKNLPFGRSHDFNLVFLRNDRSYDSRKEGTKISNISIGEEIPANVFSSEKVLDIDNQQILCLSGNKLIIYDESLNSVIKEEILDEYAESRWYGQAWNSSQNVKNIVGITNTHVLKIDRNTFNQQRIISLEDIKRRENLNYGYYLKWAVADEVGNFYICISNNAVDHRLFRYNQAKDELTLLQLEGNVSPYTSIRSVSADGRFIFLNGGICKIEGTTCSLLYDLTEVHFLPNKNEAVCFSYSIYDQERTISYLNLESLTFDENRTYTVQNLISYSLDFKYAIAQIGQSGKQPFIINLETGKAIKGLNVTAGYHVQLLASHFLYGNSERRIPIYELQ